jgi:hypothetical protein
MKTIMDKKKEADYLRKILNEDILCGKRGRTKVIRHADGMYEVQSEEWKGKFFNHDHLGILIVMGSIDPINLHEIDDRPHKRALFYNHFNKRLAELSLREMVRSRGE